MALRDEGAHPRGCESDLVHTVVGKAANVNDVTQAGALLHGDEMAACGDATGEAKAVGPDPAMGTATRAGRAVE